MDLINFDFRMASTIAAPILTMSSGGTALPIILANFVRCLIGHLNQSGMVCNLAASWGVNVRGSAG